MGKRLGKERSIALREISPDAFVEVGVLHSEALIYRERYENSGLGHW